MKLALLHALALFVVAATAFSEEKQQLFSQVFSVPRDLSIPPENGIFEGTPPPALPAALNGEPRFDAMPWLEQHLVKRAPGMSAIVLARSRTLVVRAPVAQLESVRILLSTQLEDGPAKQIEITASLWSYECDAQLDPLQRPRTLANVRALAGNSLQLLDTHTLVTKSGNRVVGQNLLSPAKSPAPPKPPKDPTPESRGEIDPALKALPGAIVELEPNIGPDGQEIDFQIHYHARLPQPNGEPDILLDLSTNTTINAAKDLILFDTLVLPRADGKAHHRALSIAAEIIDAHGRTSADIAKAAAARTQEKLAEDRELIRRAQEGIITE